MDVFGEIEPLIFVFDENVFISTLIDGPRVMMTLVVVHGISHGETTHKVGDS